MSKNSKLNIQPGRLTEEAINYGKRKHQCIEMKNERINALGLQKTAHVLIGSSQKRKSNKTEQAKKMMKKMLDDEDFQTPEGEDEFCSSSDEKEVTSVV